MPADTFGARLALVRQRMRWNVKQAAEACDIPAASWRNWEHGKPCQDMSTAARKVAGRTDADYVWLMVGGPLRNRCFSTVPGVAGDQLEFSFLPEPVLLAV